mgnify:CR=1 FL=1
MKLSEFLDRYQDNDNEWFALDHGEAQNMFDAAVESIAVLGARAERAEAERDALRDELARMSDEFADVLEVAIARGAALGYDSDSDYIQRWEELTGDEWVEE